MKKGFIFIPLLALALASCRGKAADETTTESISVTDTNATTDTDANTTKSMKERINQLLSEIDKVPSYNEMTKKSEATKLTSSTSIPSEAAPGEYVVKDITALAMVSESGGAYGLPVENTTGGLPSQADYVIQRMKKNKEYCEEIVKQLGTWIRTDDDHYVRMDYDINLDTLTLGNIEHNSTENFYSLYNIVVGYNERGHVVVNTEYIIVGPTYRDNLYFNYTEGEEITLYTNGDTAGGSYTQYFITELESGNNNTYSFSRGDEGYRGTCWCFQYDGFTYAVYHNWGTYEYELYDRNGTRFLNVDCTSNCANIGLYTLNPDSVKLYYEPNYKEPYTFYGEVKFGSQTYVNDTRPDGKNGYYYLPNGDSFTFSLDYSGRNNSISYGNVLTKEKLFELISYLGSNAEYTNAINYFFDEFYSSESAYLPDGTKFEDYDYDALKAMIPTPPANYFDFLNNETIVNVDDQVPTELVTDFYDVEVVDTKVEAFDDTFSVTAKTTSDKGIFEGTYKFVVVSKTFDSYKVIGSIDVPYNKLSENYTISYSDLVFEDISELYDSSITAFFAICHGETYIRCTDYIDLLYLETPVPEEPVEPEEPTEPVDPVEPVEPEEPTEPVGPVEPVEPEEPTEPVDPVEPVESEEPAE